jgi:GTP-binding protein
MYGLLGFPNVGKSSFLSRVTSATPKIADYHFTTLTPNLGVAKTEFGESFVIADIPGIIEGASKGVGLGLQFLRHIERTRLLLHFVDVSGTEEREPVEDFYTIQNELKAYNEKLSERKQIIVASKSDIIQDITLYEELEKLANKENMKLFKISTVTGEGINELMEYICKILKEIPKEEINPVEERVIYTLEKEENDFEIQVKGNEYIVSGSAVDRIMRRVNIQDRESMHYLQKKLEEVRYF